MSFARRHWKKVAAVGVLGLGLRSVVNRYRASLEREDLAAAATVPYRGLRGRVVGSLAGCRLD